MNPKNPLDSIFYVTLPEGYTFSHEAMQIDSAIPLPVQQKDGEDSAPFKLEDLTAEQVLAGILTVLAYDLHNEHLDYYRSIILKARPNIKKELGEAAILKARNEDFEIAEEIFMALHGLDPADNAIILNMALFFDQRAESYKNAGLLEDAEAYDNDALRYYKEVMDADEPLPDAYFNAGFFYLKQQNFAEARDCFETYIALTCDIDDEKLGENGIYKKERSQEIINMIKSQNMDDVHFKNAYDLISSGQEEKGLEEIRQFIQNNPKVWNAWFMLGWGLRKLNRFKDAKVAFDEALKCPEGDKNCDTYNEIALCLLQEKDFDGAENALMKALALENENTKVISNLGYLALAKGDIPNARKFFATVLEITPNDQIALAELAKLEAGN